MKLTRILAILLLSLCPGLYLSSEAHSTCLGEPELPPDGLAWPAVGKIDNGWSLSCATDRGHRGIDILLPAETEVRSTAGGVIAFAGYTPAEGGGMTISIDHPGGLRSTYIHLSGVLVSRGERVAQGQVLAESDGRPLHFAIRSATGRSYIDPEQHLPEMTWEASDIVPEDGLSVAPPEVPGEDQFVKPDSVGVVAESSETPGESAGVPAESQAAQPTAEPDTSPSRLPGETQAAAFIEPAGIREPQPLVVAQPTATRLPREHLAKVVEPATSTADHRPAWRWPDGLGIISPAVRHGGLMLANDGLDYPLWTLWPRREMEKPAGLGLIVSTLVLMSIRRLVWGRFQWSEIRPGSTQGDQPSSQGPLH